MNKHIAFAGIGLMAAVLLIAIVLGHNRAEAPLPADTTTTSAEPTLEATTTATSELLPLVPDVATTAPRPPVPSDQSSGCVVGGCSGQLCVEAGNEMMTTCEWRAAYACYETATCERQATGECGWTDTPDLRQCLIDSQNPEEVVELQD